MEESIEEGSWQAQGTKSSLHQERVPSANYPPTPTLISGKHLISTCLLVSLCLCLYFCFI